MMKLFNKKNKDEEGASSVEYLVLAALIIAVLVLTIAIFGGTVKKGYDHTNEVFTDVGL